jgi:hypothetical protein
VPRKNSPELETDFPADLNFDADAFSFDFEEGPEERETAGKALGIGERKLRVPSRRRLFYDLSLVPNAVRLIKPLPKKGETIHAIMGGDFHAWDLVPAALDLIGGPIAELYVTTLGFNHRNNQHLCDLISAGAVKTAFVLCSGYFQAADRDAYNEAETKLHALGSHIKAVRNHSKIICMAPAKGADRYVIESSANLRSCNNIEQFALTNDVRLFEFHREWIRKQFGRV